MTDSSSVGNPDGAALPPDHPLGPASPVPPQEKEAEFTDRAPGSTAEHGTTDDDAPANAHDPGPGPRSDDGSPAPDRREDVLDPSAGAAGHPAATIRDEQHTHDAGTVPAAFNGTGTPERPEEDRRPEDAASQPDAWDSGSAAD